MARTRIPTHPGALLREVVVPAIDMKLGEVAKNLGLSRHMLHRIMNEQAPVTAETAVRLGKLFGNGPHLWLNMQSSHDLAKAERELAGELKKIRTIKAA